VGFPLEMHQGGFIGARLTLVLLKAVGSRLVLPTEFAFRLKGNLYADNPSMLE
jgi:hypothetical protein